MFSRRSGQLSSQNPFKAIEQNTIKIKHIMNFFGNKKIPGCRVGPTMHSRPAIDNSAMQRTAVSRMVPTIRWSSRAACSISEYVCTSMHLVAPNPPNRTTPKSRNELPNLRPPLTVQRAFKKPSAKSWKIPHPGKKKMKILILGILRPKSKGED